MDISIVIPVYNSETILSKLVKEIENSLAGKNLKIELLFINDFSKDSSWVVIAKLAKEKSYIRGINLDDNYGQHNAISAGLTYARGENIILMDDDLQHDPIYIIKIFDELNKGFDSCYVKYLKRKHKFIKRTLSFLNHIISSYLSTKSFKIYTSSFKGFKKHICKKIIEDKEPEVFLDWIIVENSPKIQTIEVIHRERLEGKTNYSLKKLLTLWANMIIKIKQKNKFKYILLLGIKLIIKLVLYKIINKKILKHKFKILEKTF